MRSLMFLLFIFYGCEKSEHLPQSRLKAVLSAYEGALSMDSVPGDIAGSLMKLAADKSEKRFFRERALRVLQQYPEERVLLFLSQWPTDEEPFLAVRAFSSLAALSGQNETTVTALAQKVRHMNYPTMNEEALHILSLFPISPIKDN